MIAAVALLMAATSARIPLAFDHVGDDGLSNRFYEAIGSEIDTHRRVRVATAADAKPQILYAETNVVPIGDSDRFRYMISLRAGPTSESAILARFDGRCVIAINQCARKVVSQAVAQLVR